MKILLATPLYPPESGGPATYAKLLEEELPARGVEVAVVKFSGVRHLPKIVRHLTYAWRFWRAARDADRILALDPVSTGLPALLAARAARKPLYVKIVGDFAWEQGMQRFGVAELLDAFLAHRQASFRVRLFQRIESCVAKSARRVIVPSEYLKSVVERWGVPARRIAVVYNAPRELARERFARPIVRGPYIVSLARLVPWKGMDGLIRALGLLHARGSGVSLVIVGDGSERKALGSLARKEGVEDAVLFAGALPQDAALAYLAHAEALVLNTGYEGFSHLILEAMQLGVPVITTPIGGNVEQIEDGVSGLLVPYQNADAIAQAVERLAKEPNLRGRLIAGGKEKLKGFTRKRLLDAVVQALS